MLLFKVVLALSIYQNYCVGIYRFPHDIVYKFPLKLAQNNNLQATELTTKPEEDNVFDGHKTKPDEIQTTDGELTTTTEVNPTTDGELTTQHDENPTTDGDLTTKHDENPTTDGDLTTKHDENPTTDGDLTTKHDENPTTDSGECPPEKSLYSKKDIRVIIDFVFNQLNLNESMTEHVVPQAEDINRKLSNDLNQFVNWFQNQPEHLIHVLQGLTSVRKTTIEPEAEKIAVILKDYSQLKENIDEKQLLFKKFNKKLNKYENLCKYACEDQDYESETNHIFKRSITAEHVCSSIADLHKQINEQLTENLGGVLNKIKDNLLIINETYTKKINDIKIVLKDSALKEFGRTMYNVLKLEDEYHDFAKKINSTNTHILMYSVKDAGLQIDSKLLELQRLIEDYGNYCRNCNKGPVKRSVRQTKLLDVNKKSNTVVNKLILEKYNESELEVNKNIAETFKALNALINDPKINENYLNIVKLKQKEILEVENIERQGLEHLKSIASLESLKNLSDLDSVSKALLKTIDEKTAHLKKIII